MTNVVSRKVTCTQHEWIVPAKESGVYIGEVRDALNMAGAAYVEETGQSTSYDDFLRVRWDDNELVFWFETRKEES